MVARAFMTLACIFSTFSALCFFSLMRDSSSIQMIMIISKILPFVCLVCGIIGVAVGISFITYMNKLTISSAAMLAIVAPIVNLCGATVSLLIH